jgi:Protein of unknown function (DUF2894)
MIEAVQAVQADMPRSQRDPDNFEESLLSQHAALRQQGAGHLDPARFHYLDVLAQRINASPPDVARILKGKLDVALADYAERFRQAKQQACDDLAHLSALHPALGRELKRFFTEGDYPGMRRLGAPSAFDQSCAPLAQLNQYIQNLKQAAINHPSGSALDSSLASRSDGSAEMASVRRFKEAWSKIAAEDQVKQAVGRGPANPGPLNSHLLVLRSLALMRELSPDYLRRFLSQVNTLLWLDQVSQKHAPVKAKPVRRSRQKK